MNVEQFRAENILETPITRRNLLKKTGLLTAAALFTPSLPEKATAQAEDETIPYGVELPVTLQPQEILPADEANSLPERGAFICDYLDRPIFFEAPINGYIHTKPSTEGDTKKILMDYPDPENFTTTMSITAIDLRHHTSLEGRVDELINAIHNTQTSAEIWHPAFGEPELTPFEEGVDGRTATRVRAIIPNQTGEPIDYINTLFVEDNQTWELAILSNYLVRMHRWQPYEAMIKSFTFLNPGK